MKVLSQRNPQWAEIKIGKSQETVGKKGCLITDESSITDYIGNYHDPGWIAQNLDFDIQGRFIWASITKVKLDFVYRFYKRDDEKIQKAFHDPDQYVVLEVNKNHWLWLVGIKGGYRVMDPWFGDLIHMESRYKNITGFAILEKQDEDEWTVGDQANDEKSIIFGDSIDFLALAHGTKFVDLSHWNDIVDLSKTKSAGYEGAIHKCSQGISNKDSAYIENKKRIKDVKMAFGAYHYADAGDPLAEARWFIQNIGELGHGDLLILDYEKYTRGDADDWCLKFMNYVKEKTGHAPLLYTYHGLLNKYKFPKVAKAGYRLWAARYGLQEQEPNKKYKPATGAFKNMWAWQFCSQGEVPGINKRVDLNIII